MSSEAKYGAEYIEKNLVGGKILRPVIDQEEEYFGFVLRMPDGSEKVVWVDSDSEGNSSGWLRAEESKPSSPKKRKVLFSSAKYETWLERKKVHVLDRISGKEYHFEAKHTNRLLDKIQAEGVNPVFDRLLLTEGAGTLGKG